MDTQTVDPVVSSDSSHPESDTPDPDTPERLDPSKVRVVDIEIDPTGEVLRRDCYDPDGEAAEMGDIIKIVDGTLWLRTVDWARSDSMDDSLQLTWTPTDLSVEDTGQIKVFTWPEGEELPVEMRRN